MSIAEAPAEAPPKEPAKKAAKKASKKAAALKDKIKAGDKPEVEPAKGDVYSAPIPLDEDIFRPQSLNIDVGPMDFDEWARLGAHLNRIDKGSPFWIGDWFNLGHKKWENEAWQAFDSDQYSPDLIGEYQRVANAIPERHRRPELSYTHHKNVAGLQTLQLRKSALKWAIDNDASEAALRKHVKALKGEEDAADEPSPDKKVDHTYRISFRLKRPDFTSGDALFGRLEAHLRELEQEFGVELLGVETTPRV